MRKDDIYEILEDVDETLEIIADKYVKAEENSEVKEVVKVKVKSAMENLRSCLDYCIHDIDEKILKKHRKVLYFPYKDSKTEFKEVINKQFKGLRNKSPEIYSILESIQDFNNKNIPWLGILCRRTNKIKHDKLLKQTRKDNQAAFIPGAIRVENGASVTLSNCMLEDTNGNLLPMNFTLDSNGTVTSMGPIDNRITIEKVNWVTFTINGTDRDVLEFLTQCRSELGEMIRKVYIEIEK